MSLCPRIAGRNRYTLFRPRTCSTQAYKSNASRQQVFLIIHQSDFSTIPAKNLGGEPKYQHIRILKQIVPQEHKATHNAPNRIQVRRSRSKRVRSDLPAINRVVRILDVWC